MGSETIGVGLVGKHESEGDMQLQDRVVASSEAHDRHFASSCQRSYDMISSPHLQRPDPKLSYLNAEPWSTEHNQPNIIWGKHR